MSRGVVVEAYQRLVDEGLAVAGGARGTAGGAAARPACDRPPRPERLPAAALGRTSTSTCLSGVPDLSAFPRAAWLRAERAVLVGCATNADLGYGDPRGNPRLRAELAGWLGA